MAETPRERARLAQVAAWQGGLAVLQGRLAPRFRRPEVRRLLAVLLLDGARPRFRLHWSRWRRRRQAEARRSHDKRRLARPDPEVSLES